MVTWVVQENMLAQETRDSLKQACNLAQVEYFPINLVPFSNELPELPEGKKFFWGTTALAKLVCPNEGLFYSPEFFSMAQYLKHWKKNMLTSDAEIIEFRDLCKLKGLPGPWFVRPDADDKSFCGEVLEWSDIESWLKEPSRFDNDGLNFNTKIMIGKPLKLCDEIRCYIVDGKLVTASYYRKNCKLHYENIGCYRSLPCLFCELNRFVKSRCSEYMPARNFVLDVAAYSISEEYIENWDISNELYVIEAGCINYCGFYDCDLPRLVKKISESMK